MREAELQLTLFGDNPEYENFEAKFKVKKTTDDCYTPENVYEAVAAWVCREYSVDRESFVRPFWPDLDYETFNYPEGCVVVDNPPFSLRKQIIDFYCDRGIHFFIFSPALTLISDGRDDVCHIATGAGITYENGAEVPTSFVTDLEPGVILRTSPDLFAAIDAANRANIKNIKKQTPRYEYPDEVITAAIAQRWTHYGLDYKLRADDGIFIRALDAQRAKGKTVFGGGYLLKERAAQERAAATKWQLSERERALIRRKEDYET